MAAWTDPWALVDHCRFLETSGGRIDRRGRRRCPSFKDGVPRDFQRISPGQLGRPGGNLDRCLRAQGWGDRLSQGHMQPMTRFEPHIVSLGNCSNQTQIPN